MIFTETHLLTRKMTTNIIRTMCTLHLRQEYCPSLLHEQPNKYTKQYIILFSYISDFQIPMFGSWLDVQIGHPHTGTHHRMNI